MFSKSMLDFFQDLLKQVPLTKDITTEQHVLFRMCMSFYFSVVVRQNDRKQIIEGAMYLLQRMRVYSRLAV